MSALVLELYEDPDQPGTHRVDLSLDFDDENPMGVIFHGPNAALRAKAYADWLYGLANGYEMCGK